MGRVGLPAPIRELAGRRWDAIVVGGGHNGLAAAGYLARAGRQVLVLEARERVGGACTLEQPFDDPAWHVSPCAYLVGLLHPRVVEELELAKFGYAVEVVDPHLWCPLEDGSALTLWNDPARSAAEVAALSRGDVEGFVAYEDLFARLRRALRGPDEKADTWLGEAPTRDEVVARLADDGEAVDVVLGASIAEVLERHMQDIRLHTALHGQGIIGTYAGPRDAGTAAVHAMHASGTLEGRGGAWGYVRGGMGRVSFALADAARAAGAVVATGVPVARVVPGQGVLLEGGEIARADVVVSNADPKQTLALCAAEVPDGYRRRVERWRTDSPVVKVNCGLARLPRFDAARDDAPFRAMVTISTGVDDTQAACGASRRGVPSPAWCELYFQTAYDPTIAPRGKHTMSVFAQYAPYRLAAGDWVTRREEIGDLVLAGIARFAPDVVDVVEERQVLGPPDIESRTGLTGGHIFQGECLPDQMWEQRFSPRTPVEGLYLCGAATHPGGSVIGVNGRNAAMAVLADRAEHGRARGAAS
jgi:phytoene dehydrogenase-like protein